MSLIDTVIRLLDEDPTGWIVVWGPGGFSDYRYRELNLEITLYSSGNMALDGDRVGFFDKQKIKAAIEKRRVKQIATHLESLYLKDFND